ncbi:MAG TPA: poly(3-hydroxybutyrate) depolymerase, partial [Ramlibacter sp.]|nr:poly(3-hydroxybutyrate) depolymerase [Ramlibacter sp.]
AFLLARKGEPLPLSRLQLKKELISEYKDLLPAIPMDEARRVRGEQELVVRYEPEKAVATLPLLLPDRADRERLLSLLERVLADQRVQKMKPSPEQLAMLERIREALPVQASNVRKMPARSGRRAA